MKEVIGKDLKDDARICIYPHIPADATERQTSGCGYVESVYYWPDVGKPEKVWGVSLNIGYRGPQDMKSTSELIAAINRCWEWIAEQSAIARTPAAQPEGGQS